MRFILSLVFIFANSICFAQTETVHCKPMLDSLTNLEYYPSPEKFPKVKGGDEVLFNQLNNLVYPSMQKPPLNTKIWVGFIVNSDGSIQGKRVLKDIEGFDFGQQVLNLVDKVTWIPGECNGNKVACMHRFPVILEFR